MDNKYIEIYNILTNIDEEYFFKDLISKCYKNSLIDDIAINKIYNSRLELLRIQLRYYTKDKSSSVMVEVAEKILNGIDYSVGIYLKSLKNIEIMINELKKYRLEDILKKGQDIIKHKVIKNSILLSKIKKEKLKVKNVSYNDTINYGVSLFFKEYDYSFAPHETGGSIDYQLCIDNMKYVGIEYIENYLNTLDLENEFCSKFNIKEINELLKGYRKDSDFLLINIFELVIINSLGLIICDKPISSLNISNKERDIIINKLSSLSFSELNDKLRDCALKLYEQLNIRNINLINYIDKAILKITKLIKSSIELDKLEELFISFIDDDNYIKYIDKEKMSNVRFRMITEKIRDSQSIDEKISIIKENIKSLEDLIDMLGSDCIFDEEFNIYFKSLSQFEIILIYKYISDISLDDIYNKEWYSIFNKYICTLTEQEINDINAIAEKVLLI
ncbi:DUF6179 domain-containing protein [Clostridium sp. AL.422]|uniref:DUF6179 domain-containing protein n=1 Tax=Clostridium TaxID=1485 RepID=UPI00293DB0BB|nr:MULTISPECIES: DUF6179 domain-containing protein [unclassified Clostridium]MDV4149586.1 DUF6179 domain-containing protein [Clostridium sp. AL.422]